MSSNYSANQFEKSFAPTKLGNWEIPKVDKSQRPKSRHGITKTIANEKGHLLAGKAKWCKSPWAHLYYGTFKLPKRITRKIADEIARGKFHMNDDENLNNQLEGKFGFAINRDQNEIGTEPREKGTPKVRTIAVETDNASIRNEENWTEQNNTSPIRGNESEIQNIRSNNEELIQLGEKRDGEERNEFDVIESTVNSGRPTPTINKYCSNADIARNLMKENRSHHLLADKLLDDSKSCKMFNHCEDTLTKPATAIGYKTFIHPGPTQCSKITVFRPFTACAQETKPAVEHRPKSVPAKKRQITEIDLALYWDIDRIKFFNSECCNSQMEISRRDNMMGDSPIRGNSEVKRFLEKTIENASKNMNEVRSHSENERKISSNMQMLSNRDDSESKTEDMACNPLEKKTNIDENENISNKSFRCFEQKSNSIDHKSEVVKDQNNSPENENPKVKTSKIPSKNSHSENLQNQTDYEKRVLKEVTCQKRLDSPCDSEKRINLRTEMLKRFCSAPNLSVAVQTEPKMFKKFKSRICLACDSKPEDQNREKIEFKSAFKAGIPMNSRIDEKFYERQMKVDELYVPKPKYPYAKKNYRIGSLIPPFSVLKDNSSDYPEQWRLSTVYRQSYKPIDMRKNPMIKTIYR